MPDVWPKAPLAPTGGASARSRSMRGGPSIAGRSGGYRVASSASFVSGEAVNQECARRSVHSGGLRCGGVVMDRFVGLGRAWVLDHPPGRTGGPPGCPPRREHRGEEAVRLQSQELGPRRPDPPWCRAESALSKHRGDGRGRDIDREFQELPSDPEVAPPDSLRAIGCQPPPRAALTARLAASTMSRGEGRLGTALRARETCPERTW